MPHNTHPKNKTIFQKVRSSAKHFNYVLRDKFRTSGDTIKLKDSM